MFGLIATFSNTGLVTKWVACSPGWQPWCVWVVRVGKTVLVSNKIVNKIQFLKINMNLMNCEHSFSNSEEDGISINFDTKKTKCKASKKENGRWKKVPDLEYNLWPHRLINFSRTLVRSQNKKTKLENEMVYFLYHI